MRTIQPIRYVVLGMLAVLFSAAVPCRALELKQALGQIESGATKATRCATDAKVGTKREVSRYQILPVAR